MAWVKVHKPCPHCGSSDASSLSDEGWWHCFSCEKNWKDKEGGKMTEPKEKVKGDAVIKGEFKELPRRGIDKATAKFFGVKVDEKGNIFYPYYDSKDNLVASKVRLGTEKKDFRITGDFSKATLFGQNLFGGKGKYITIVEGQDDALACYKMLGSKWDVVSVHSASSAVKDVLNNIDFLESYENIVIMFDSDDVGKEASRKVAEKLSPQKAKIVTLNRYKDANDYLINNKVLEFQREWWNQKSYTPAGVVSFSDAWSQFVNSTKAEIIKLPQSMPELSAMMKGGVAKGEITTIGALTSVGKTSFVNNFLFDILSETDSRVGYCGLETTVGELTKGLLSLATESNLSHQENLNLDNLKSKFDDMKWKDNLKILDHQGSLDLDSLTSKIRNMIVAYDLDVFLLDPLQQALPTLDNDTVKEAMDILLKLAKQTNVSFIIVSHMRKPDSKDPHAVSEYDLLGSSAINQVSFNTILLSRDKMSENEVAKNSLKLQLVKCRRTGITGNAGWLFYNVDKARLEHGAEPDLFEE